MKVSYGFQWAEYFFVLIECANKQVLGLQTNPMFSISGRRNKCKGRDNYNSLLTSFLSLSYFFHSPFLLS